MQKLWERLGSFYKYRDLLVQLVARDIKMKYRRSFLGYVWSILNPLLIMIVLTLVFSQLFQRNIRDFPAYLICGQVLFNYMTDATNGAMVSITANAALLKKTYVPKYIFTVARVTSGLVNLLFSFGALLIVFVATGISFTWYALLWFIPVLQLYVFSLGLGLFLAQLAVFFRDIQYIYSVITTAWLYLTPTFYSVDILPVWLQSAVTNYNPMSLYITQFRDLLYDGRMVDPHQVLVGSLIALAFLLIGMWTFLRSKDRFILHI